MTEKKIAHIHSRGYEGMVRMCDVCLIEMVMWLSCDCHVTSPHHCHSPPQPPAAIWWTEQPGKGVKGQDTITASSKVCEITSKLIIISWVAFIRCIIYLWVLIRLQGEICLAVTQKSKPFPTPKVWNGIFLYILIFCLFRSAPVPVTVCPIFKRLHLGCKYLCISLVTKDNLNKIQISGDYAQTPGWGGGGGHSYTLEVWVCATMMTPLSQPAAADSRSGLKL